MIDLELFKSAIRAIEEGFIEPGDTLTPDIVEFLTSLPKTRADILFKRANSTESPGTYKLIGNCFTCPSQYSLTGSKTKIINHLHLLRTGTNCLCQSCAEKQTARLQAKREDELKRRAEEKAAFALAINERTERFCSLYLDPESDPFTSLSWTPWKRMNHIQTMVNSCDKEYVSQVIKYMPYREFLMTPYWKSIALYIKKRAEFKCALCSSVKGLNAHHKTYKNHGHEIDFIHQDFICLCSNCHGTFHAEGKVV